ncbi:MAG: hypothetical protein ACI9UA_003768, partial [Pseudoalteromonas tetraodonis]
WCLEFVCHGGPSLKAYPDFKRSSLVPTVSTESRTGGLRNST